MQVRGRPTNKWIDEENGDKRHSSDNLRFPVALTLDTKIASPFGRKAPFFETNKKYGYDDTTIAPLAAVNLEISASSTQQTHFQNLMSAPKIVKMLAIELKSSMRSDIQSVVLA